MVACQPEFGAPGMSGRPSHSAGHAPTSRAVRPVSEFRVTIRPTRATRRAVLAAGASIVTLGAAGPLRAALVPTPRQTEGPFYPTTFPLDSDNDLITVAGRGERAQGTPPYLDGRILDAAGREVADARVEIDRDRRGEGKGGAGRV